MKKILLLSALFIYSLNGFSQAGTTPSCLIGHWDMDSSTNDVSGNGNNGTGHALTPAIGRDGIMGHAFYFNGVSSYIWVPYDSTFNLQQFTIVATVQVMGYYTGLCQANLIFGRGKTGAGTGTYGLMFSPQPGDGGSCTYFDSIKQNFFPTSGDFSPASITDYDVAPYIVDNMWYKVVATFNDTTFKVYVNDTLKASVPTSSIGWSFGVTTDGINIGLNTFEPAYPYGFKGIIDDVQLYNCAFPDSVITTLGIKNDVNQNLGDDVFLYPNPSNSIITISMPDASCRGDIQLYNQLGQIVEEQHIAGRTVQLNMESLPNGIYFIKVSIGSQIIYKKVFKS